VLYTSFGNRFVLDRFLLSSLHSRFRIVAPFRHTDFENQLPKCSPCRRQETMFRLTEADGPAWRNEPVMVNNRQQW
jgi:hypothetical protein